MNESPKLLNLKEVSRILSVNTEVLRRWLRNKKLPGIKVGSDWRVREKDLQHFLNPVADSAISEKTAPKSKMCFKFPKWLEFSGLPLMLNQKFGHEAWPVFKKIIELDFEHDPSANRQFSIDMDELSARVGYYRETVEKIIQKLHENGFVVIKKSAKETSIRVVTPIKTPKLVLDISFENGGVKGAPSKMLENSCLRRFLETDESEL